MRIAPYGGQNAGSSAIRAIETLAPFGHSTALTTISSSTMSILFRLSLVCTAALPAWGAATAELTKEQTEFFEQKIRPILADNCYQCHSVEQGKSKGDLTLDTKKGWEKGGESGPAIVPGDPEKSALFKAVSYT